MNREDVKAFAETVSDGFLIIRHLHDDDAVALDAGIGRSSGWEIIGRSSG